MILAVYLRFSRNLEALGISSYGLGMVYGGFLGDPQVMGFNTK